VTEAVEADVVRTGQVAVFSLPAREEIVHVAHFSSILRVG
jgi:hypothetical protein